MGHRWLFRRERPLPNVLLSIFCVVVVVLFATQLYPARQLAATLNAKAAPKADAAPSDAAAAASAAEAADREREQRELLESAERLVPACAQGRGESFVILFMGHSGSTALISALRQNAEVLVEAFEPVDKKRYEADTEGALRLVDDFFTRARQGGRVGGLKIRPRHIRRRPARWAALFRKHRTRIIWNYRANVFKQAVGHYPILYLNDTRGFEGLHGNARGVGSFEIRDSDLFYDLLSRRWRGEREVEKALSDLGAAPAGSPTDGELCAMPVSYELLNAAPAKTMVAMQQFLGVKVNATIHPERRKATNDNLCKVVKNWAALCRNFFICDRWRAMMDDSIVNDCSCRVPLAAEAAGARKYCEPEAG